tara:strand:+ start:396 stop:944 length:549 start_codon:yes stop_codon:yes gene_type:complete
MAGQITPKNNNAWDPENESWDEYKVRRSEGQMGTGQPNSQKNARGLCPNTDKPKRGCDCRTCINRRNRSKGRRKQNMVRKKLGIPDRKFHGADAHEENWRSAVRIEVKAGQQVGPISTRFKKAEAQSWENVKNIEGGKGKPFMMVAMPDGETDGIVLFRLSQLKEVVLGILENWENPEEDKY